MVISGGVRWFWFLWLWLDAGIAVDFVLCGFVWLAVVFWVRGLGACFGSIFLI